MPKPVKVLIVYESLATPSTTVRALQFRDCFAQDADFQTQFVGRTSERMNAVMQRWPWRPSVRRPALAVESAIIRRRENQIVAQAKQSDIVMMMTVPSWSLHQRLAELPSTRLVMDLIDALWLPCFQDHGWRNIHDMLASSAAVICENEFTANYTRDHNPHVHVLPDAPQVEVFDRLRDQVLREPDECRIGWIGGKYTADALYKVFEPLERLFEQHAHLHLRLVGADPDRIPRFEHVRYSVVSQYDQDRMVREALAMHIGLFPMFDVSESLYRGTLKTRVYMAGEVAVVGQRLGENETLIEEGVNGMLAGTDDQWYQALQRLIEDEAFRRRIAAGGRETIRRGYTREMCYQRLREVLLTTV